MVCSSAAPVRGRRESAGHAFHAQARRSLGLGSAERAADGAAGDVASETDEDSRRRAEWEARKKSRGDNLVEAEDENLYEILELGHVGFKAGPKQIRKAYQKMLLKYHPDKTDKNSETLPLDREEVTCDLLQLLEA